MCAPGAVTAFHGVIDPRATVWVHPEMLPAAIIVAPKWPRDRANASAVAARIGAPRERRASRPRTIAIPMPPEFARHARGFCPRFRAPRALISPEVEGRAAAQRARRPSVKTRGEPVVPFPGLAERVARADQDQQIITGAVGGRTSGRVPRRPEPPCRESNDSPAGTRERVPTGPRMRWNHGHAQAQPERKPVDGHGRSIIAESSNFRSARIAL